MKTYAFYFCATVTVVCYPRGIAYDPSNGFLYVTNATNSTVTTYDGNGVQQTLSGTFPNLNVPFGITVVP